MHCGCGAMSEHEPWCQKKTKPHTDAAKKVCDTYNLHKMADPRGSIGRWFACALADGETDGVLYDSKRDAVRHQHHNESRYTFLKVGPSSMNVCEAEVMLGTARQLYEKGLRMSDPDARNGGPDVIKRLMVEDQLNMLRGVASNLVIPIKN